MKIKITDYESIRHPSMFVAGSLWLIAAILMARDVSLLDTFQSAALAGLSVLYSLEHKDV